MKVWIYCYSNNYHCDLKEREIQMLKFAVERRMDIMGVTSLNLNDKSEMKDVLKALGKRRGDGIVIYDMEELPLFDRTLLLDAIHLRKITIFCCRYTGKEVV